MIRAHLRRFFGGGLGGPLRSLPQESVARAKPALEVEPSSLGDVICDEIRAASSRLPRESVPLSSAGFAGTTNPGGRFRKGGEAPLRVERTGSTPRVRPSGAALLLIYKDEKVWDEMSTQEKGTIFQQAVDFSEGLRKRGVYHGGEPLEPTSTATTVRMKNGKTVTTDG